MVEYTEEGHRRDVLSLEFSVYHWVSAMHCTFSCVSSTQYTADGHRRVSYVLCLYTLHRRGTQRGVPHTMSLQSTVHGETGGCPMSSVSAQYRGEGTRRRVQYELCLCRVYKRGTHEGVLCPVSLTSGHPSQRAADWPHKKQTLSFITMKVIKPAMLVTTSVMKEGARTELDIKN